MRGASYYPQEQRYQTYREATEKPLEASPSLSRQPDTETFKNRTPCRDPEGKDESDLCAQWKAANAAEDGAFWTKWGVWIGVVGSCFLLWQIILTRRAVEDTGQATEAMREANEIMRAAEDAKIVISISETEFSFGVGFFFSIKASNIGRSAATIHSIAIEDDKSIIERPIKSGEDIEFVSLCFMPWEHPAPCVECLSGEKPDDVMMEMEYTTPLSGRRMMTVPCSFWSLPDDWKVRANFEHMREESR